MADRKGVFSMLGDLTAAQRLLYSQAAGRSVGAPRRRRKTKKTRVATGTRKRRRAKRGKLTKGSAAAKAWGRKMKALRKRR
jgi:hypothetical protein